MCFSSHLRMEIVGDNLKTLSVFLLCDTSFKRSLTNKANLCFAPILNTAIWSKERRIIAAKAIAFELS